MNNSRFSLDAILFHNEEFDLELKSTISKIDCFLYNDNYWDFEIAISDDFERQFIGSIDINGGSLDTNLCRYYGIQYFYQWENLFFQDLVCCNFSNLGNGGQVDNCINPCEYYLNTPFNLLTNVRIEDLHNCNFNN